MLEGAMLGGFIALLLMTPSDPDLWGHLRFGLDALHSGDIVRPDVYSFTSDRPWINHEWLSELLMAVTYRWLGTSGLLLLKLVVVLAAGALAAFVLRRRPAGLSRLLVFVFILAAGLYPLTHTIRPQIFSVFCFTALLAVVTALDRGRRELMLLLPPLFCFWANTHGGWLVGAGVYAIWALWQLADPATARRDRIIVAVTAVAAAGATLINPYGVGLWRFLLETVRLARPDIEEWQSIAENRELLIPWLITVLLLAGAVARQRPKRWRDILIAVVLAFASFKVSRLGAFFALGVGLLLCVPDDNAAPARGHARQADLAGALVCALIVGVVLWQTPKPVSCLRASPDLGLDAAATTFIGDHELRGRLVVWFDWGEYALWHFGPSLRVSMDGRRETVYSESTLRAQLDLYEARGDARTYLEGLHADYVWLPPGAPLNQHLGEWGWQQVFVSDQSVLWSAQPLPATVPRAGAVAQCFPGA